MVKVNDLKPVAVIGLGNMGSALAGKLLVQLGSVTNRFKNKGKRY